jgi:glutathione synthase/RimK-type ligase-like ATP-grasp enzyme
MNPPLASGPFEHKPAQLAALVRAGIPVPKTCVTSSPEEVRAFAGSVRESIVKPLTGGAETRALDEALLSRIDRGLPGPVIVQERVLGSDVRVTIVGDRVVSSVEIPTSEIDYRSSEHYQRGDQRYVPYVLPAEIEELCLRAARTCNQVLSGIDLKRTPSGDHVLLEANSAPMYLDIEEKTGHRVTEAVIEWLCS